RFIEARFLAMPGEILEQPQHSPRANQKLNPVEREKPGNPIEVEDLWTEPLGVRDRLGKVLVGAQSEKIVVRQLGNPAGRAKLVVQLGAWIRREQRDAHVVDAGDGHASEKPHRLAKLLPRFVWKPH